MASGWLMLRILQQQKEKEKLIQKQLNSKTETKKTMLKDKFKKIKTAQDKKEIDINGYWLIKDNPMTKAGVFPYLGKQISPELEPSKIYQVLRPKEELTKPETLKSLELIPLLNDHEMVGKDFTPVEEKGSHGTTGQNVKVNGNIITNDLRLLSEVIKNEVESGKKDLSMGYRCRYELTPGEFEGQHYDAIQRDIIYNHIALVDEGRMGSDVRVMDSFTFDSIKDLTKETTTMAEEKTTQDTDKRELIREVMAIAAKPNDDFAGGEEEKIDTITKKLEEIAYNPSESGANDEDIEEEKKTEDEEGKPCKDEDPKEEEKPTEDEDKRKLIDEIGGILKGKVDDEIWRTIIGKVEKVAYEPSETGANDEDPKKDDEEKPVSMDAAIKYLARKDNLVNKLKPVIGENVKFPSMTIKEITKYACDKLDIKNSIDSLEGYLAAHKKTADVKVSLDNAPYFGEKRSPVIENYLK